MNAKEHLKGIVEDFDGLSIVDINNITDLMESYHQAKLKESGVVEALESIGESIAPITLHDHKIWREAIIKVSQQALKQIK